VHEALVGLRICATSLVELGVALQEKWHMPTEAFAYTHKLV